MSPDLQRELFGMLATVRASGEYVTLDRAVMLLAERIAAHEAFADFHAAELAQHVIEARIQRQPLDLDDYSLRPMAIPAD